MAMAMDDDWELLPTTPVTTLPIMIDAIAAHLRTSHRNKQ